ncbi:HAD-IA family hydrolase [Aeromonas veronii]|uniref:HAD-IA family hydrolase n=1 Tax=Aeromonas veronii TaxID=654 RepID=UPI00195C8F8C|nr:HAD-IA family hydrolase [Aeromonas veronii]EKP0299220.1 HAD-IA family hydrolase [Aeromonas veronii]UZE58682.1 HAD-IA family hydrolase [Aeromonas veronii]
MNREPGVCTGDTKTVVVAALLLDMDGTLVCSTDDVEQVWRIWCRDHQLDPEPVLAMCHGMRSREVIRVLALQLDVEREAARLDELEMLHTGGDAIAGAGELLRRLPPQRWAIVTSASEQVARHRLRCAGLPLPHVLVGAEAVINGKPDPEPYLLGAKRLDVSPDCCLVFEDAPAGIESALRAGCTVVQVGGDAPLNPAVVAVIRDWREVKVELGEDDSLLVTLPA